MRSVLDSLLTVIWIMIECVILLYYTNSAMQYKHSKLTSNITVICGYVVYSVFCLLGNQMINIIGFNVVNFIVLYFGFRENIGSIIFKVIILTAFMMFGELVASFSLGFAILPDLRDVWAIYQGVLICLFSKSIYFIMIIILKRMTTTNYDGNRSYETVYLLILPISTCMFLWLLNKMILNESTEYFFILSIIGTFLVISNFIVYVIYDKIIDNNIKIQQLQAVQFKNELDYKSYQQ